LHLRRIEIGLVLDARGLLDPVGIVQSDAQIAGAADAGFRAHGWRPCFDARIAEDALLGCARRPVVVDLLVGTSGDAHAPAAALFLIDQDDAVFLALVDRARWTGGRARRVQAVLAKPRQ